MKKKTPTKILALDPGTRYLGVAFLEGLRPVHLSVRTITNRTSNKSILTEGVNIIRRCLKDFQPDILAIEKTFFGKSPNVALLNVFAKEIVRVGRRARVPMVRLAPTTIRKRLCGNGHANKREVARVLVARYPELRVFLTQDRKWKERYHSNMFDALALGVVVAKE